VLALFSLLPILVIGIRWPSFLGDTSKYGSMATRLLFRIMHGFFLLVCVWVAFDPPFSPRGRQMGIPFLSLYYLGALTVGYCAGYFLLLASRKPSRWRRVGQGTVAANGVITACVWALLLLVPAGLVHKNLPPIRLANGPMYWRYASLMTEALPARQAVVLSDDPRRMLMVQAAAARAGKSKDYVFVDSGSLIYADYHRYLKKIRPDLWPKEVPEGYQQAIEQVELMRLLGELAGKTSLYYLHHSFGYFFELFNLEPRGMICKLNPYPNNALLGSPMSLELLDQNKAFWAKAEAEAIQPLLAAMRRPETDGRGSAVTRAARQLLSRAESADTRVLGALYAHALVYWGVELQKHRQFKEAGDSFRLAQSLNPRNFVAEINLRCNTNLLAGVSTQIGLSKALEDELSKYSVWEQMVGDNGPFDEPGFCYEQGRVLVRGNNFRQAAQQFARVKDLDPQDFNAAMWLGELYLMNKMPDEALKLVDEIRSRPLASATTNLCELLLVEASAHLAKDDYAAAGAVIRSAIGRHPGDAAVLQTAAQVYLNFKSYSNALPILDRQLQLNPTNMTALVNKGFVCLQLNAYDQAIPPLTKVLSIETNNYSALLNRAIAALRCDRLEEARQDYEILAKVFTNAFQVYYGLGEIAYRKKNKAEAIRNYELYLSKAPPAEEATAVTERLRELNSSP
jgi:tetratricopeptide (TPR) repeat protein